MGHVTKINIRSGAIVSCYEDITVVLLLIGVMLRRYVTMVSYISYNINVRPCAKALRYIGGYVGCDSGRDRKLFLIYCFVDLV